MSPQVFWYDTVLVTWPHLQSKQNKSLKLATHKKIIFLVHPSKTLETSLFLYRRITRIYFLASVVFNSRTDQSDERTWTRIPNEESFRSQMSRQDVCFCRVQHQSLSFILRVLNCLSWVVLGFFLITSNQFGMWFWSNFQNNVGLERLWRAQKLSDGSVLVWSCLCWSCLFSFSAICLFSYFKSSDVKNKTHYLNK